jgi:hypothetical protein
LLVVIAVFALVGCGGGGDGANTPAPIPPTVDITGTWDASMTATGGTQLPVGSRWTVVLTAIQSGSAVSGTFSTAGGLVGQASGTVSGDDISFTVTQGPVCAGTFNGFGLVNGNQMSGTYSGADCHGTLQASFTATKR